MFIQPCFIRKNTKELRDKLKDLGYKICKCCEFEYAIWLNNYIPTNSIHGTDYSNEEIGISAKESLNLFLEENSNYVDCGTNEDLFLAIAALRDDTDKNQYFKHNSKNHFYKCDMDSFKDYFATCNKELNDHLEDYHKATIDELKELLHTKKIYCSQCGGTNILKEAWVDANTLIYVNDTYNDRYYCEDCMEEVNVIIK